MAIGKICYSGFKSSTQLASQFSWSYVNFASCWLHIELRRQERNKKYREQFWNHSKTVIVKQVGAANYTTSERKSG